MSETQDVAQEATQEAQEIANQETPEAAQEQAATDGSETEAESSEKDTQANEKTFTQAELDDIIKKRIAKATAIAERKASKVYAEKLEQLAIKPQAETKAATVEGRPKLAQYEDAEDWADAVFAWNLKTHQQEQTRKANEQRVVQTQRQIEEKSQHVYDLAEQNPEFNSEEFDALLSRPELSGEMAFAIIDSEVAPKLMVYLQKNPEEVDRIAKLSPARQAAEIGKMEVKLSAPKEVKVSKAPAPVKPVGSRGSTSSNNPGEMPQAEFEKWLFKNTKR